jgi:hypothetical protein
VRKKSSGKSGVLLHFFIKGSGTFSRESKGSDSNGAYLRDIVHILKNQWPRKHTENTEYSQIISVSSVDSVDSVAIYHDFDLSKRHSTQTRSFASGSMWMTCRRCTSRSSKACPYMKPWSCGSHGIIPPVAPFESVTAYLLCAGLSRGSNSPSMPRNTKPK